MTHQSDLTPDPCAAQARELDDLINAACNAALNLANWKRGDATRREVLADDVRTTRQDVKDYVNYLLHVNADNPPAREVMDKLRRYLHPWEPTQEADRDYDLWVIQSALRATADAARAGQREEWCRRLCVNCCNGDPVVKDQSGNWFHSYDEFDEPCVAAVIRAQAPGEEGGG